MNATPKISVIMAAYNVAPYLPKAFDSILAQSMPDFEIVIVDDCSTDETREVIGSTANKDPRVKPVYQERNQGVGVARNTAIDNASGDWIAVVDTDDWISDHRLQSMLTVAEDHAADLVADDQYLVESEEEEPKQTLLSHGEKGVELMTAQDFLQRDAPETKGYGLLKPIMRRALLNQHGIRYRTAFSRIEDCLLYSDCLAHGAKFYLTAEPMYFYRIKRDGALTQQFDGLDALKLMSRGQDIIEEAFAATADAGTKQAVEHRRHLINQSLYYREVLTLMRRREVGRAAKRFLGELAFAPNFMSRLARAASRRVSG